MHENIISGCGRCGNGLHHFKDTTATRSVLVDYRIRKLDQLERKTPNIFEIALLHLVRFLLQFLPRVIDFECTHSVNIHFL